jgi:hypothetical protein
MTLSNYHADPDGNYVELQMDAFGDWAWSKAWMNNSNDFKTDPIGQFVDPAAVAADPRGRHPVRGHPRQGDARRLRGAAGRSCAVGRGWREDAQARRGRRVMDLPRQMRGTKPTGCLSC